MKNKHLLTVQVEEYIEYKRSLGYQIKVEAEELRRFAEFAASIGHIGSLTSTIAIRWASLEKEYSRLYMARRLEIVHTFARYISAFDPQAQIPQTGIFGKCHIRISPHIYSDAEISLLVNEADNLFSPDGIRSHTVATAMGLLCATGLRVSELTGLKCKDVRLQEGYLYIDSSKFKKTRLVPLHDSAIDKLKQYNEFIEMKLGARDQDEYFFVSSYGKRFNTRSFEYAFQLLRTVLPNNRTNNRTAKTRSPRLTDFRHTFACKTIRRWLESGEDVNQKLHLLSTYMGHVKPGDTYWYLSATPELLLFSSRKYEAAFGMEAAK